MAKPELRAEKVSDPPEKRVRDAEHNENDVSIFRRQGG
jgi:hypothetical protein